MQILEVNKKKCRSKEKLYGNNAELIVQFSPTVHVHSFVMNFSFHVVLYGIWCVSPGFERSSVQEPRQRLIGAMPMLPEYF